MLPKSKTPGQLKNSELTFLIYGKPKIGKSTFANATNPLVIPTERGLGGMECYQTDMITSWSQFVEVVRALKNASKHPYDSVSIDTLGNLQGMVEDHVCQKTGVKHISELGFGKGYGLASSEWRRVFTALKSLPMMLILIAHEKSRIQRTRAGEFSVLGPNLTGGIKEWTEGDVDFILRFDMLKGKRVIYTSPPENGEFVAGSRYKILEPIVDMRWDVFNKAIRGVK